jgi:hypothetical protein
MKKVNLTKLALTLAAVIALLVAPALAQKRMGRGKGMPLYNPATEVTVTGTIEAVNQIACPNCPLGRTGTHLTVKTATETLDVHLGPSDFVAESKFALAEGDRIEITGSRVQAKGKDALIAREVKKDGNILTLRNAQGIPRWSKGRRRY